MRVAETSIEQIEPGPGDALALYQDPDRHHIILCCDCEGTWEQLHRLWEPIAETGVAANFFFVGDTAREFPQLVQEIARTQQVESHTMHHANLRKLSKADQECEILEGRSAVEAVIGRPTRGFRAPFHAYNKHTVEILNEQGFVFDASRLYYFHDMRNVAEVKPTWFREWMPLYHWLMVSPRSAFGFFSVLASSRHLTVLPAHPQYSGMNATMSREFHRFLKWAVASDFVFWPIDKWLQVRDQIAPPQWVSPLGPVLGQDDTEQTG